MGNKTYIFNTLARDYGDFRAPTYKLKVDGKDLVAKGVAVSNIRVDLTSSLETGGCDFTVANAYDLKERKFNKQWMSSYFVPGNIVEVEMGYVKTKVVFYGAITTITPSFEAGQSPSLNIKCLDAKNEMKNSVKCSIESAKKDSDLVKTVLGQYKLNKSIKQVVVSDTPENAHFNNDKDPIIRNFESDYDFVVKCAKEVNYRFYILHGAAYFKKIPDDKKPVITLEWGANLISFNRSLDVSTQPKKIVVLSHNEMEKTQLKGIAEGNYDKVGDGGDTPDKYSKAVNKNAVKYVIDVSAKSQQEVNDRAKAMLNQESMKMVTGSGKCIGLPEIEPGRYLEVKKLDPTLDGLYYLTKVTHSISSSGFFTDFNFEVNAV